MGFTKGCNTELNVFSLINNTFLFKKKFKNIKPILIFIDFKAAFDSVDHKILIDEL